MKTHEPVDDRKADSVGDSEKSSISGGSTGDSEDGSLSGGDSRSSSPGEGPLVICKTEIQNATLDNVLQMCDIY